MMNSNINIPISDTAPSIEFIPNDFDQNLVKVMVHV